MEIEQTGVLASFGMAIGSIIYGYVQARGRIRDKKDWKAIAETQEAQLSDQATKLDAEKTARIELLLKVDQLEDQSKKRDDLLSEMRAKLTIITDERELERHRYQQERDEVMIERGQIKAQMVELQRKTDALQQELNGLREKNEALKATNDKLEEYREVAREQKRQMDALQSQNRTLESENQRLKDVIRLLENRNPDPPPADALEPTG